MKKNVLYTLMMVMACAIAPAYAHPSVATSATEQGNTYLESEKNVYFGTDASERQVTVKTNQDFTVASNAKWCKVKRTNDAVSITVKANTKAADRTAKVSLKTKGGPSQVIKV